MTRKPFASMARQTEKLILLISVLVLCNPLATADNVIHKQKSLYRNILVKDSASRRCLVFAVKKGDRNQTCMDLKNPKRVVFPYARMTFAGLLVNPDPGTILIIGLGGGTIPTTLAELYPDAVIDVVEIDPAVIDVARTYFNYKENPGSTVYAQDARVYIKRAGIRNKRYDMVILDAFTGDYIPEHLMTVEFLQETNALLSPSGVLIANTFSTSALYDHESVTYAAVFDEFINFKMPITGNRVIIASKQPLPSRREMFDRSRQLTARLENYGINLAGFLTHLTTRKDWREDVRPLTDQFSPANLLRDR